MATTTGPLGEVAPTSPLPSPSRRQVRRWAAGGAGVAAMLVLWSVAAHRQWFDGAIPAPSAVWDVLSDPLRRKLFVRATRITASEAAKGLAIGSILAIGLATVPLLVPALHRTTERIAATVQALPVIVLGPVLVTVFSARQVPVVIAALGAFFAMFVPAAAALRSVSAAQTDLVVAYGGGRWRRVRVLHLPMSLPGLATGLRLAAPAAVLGAVFGEWFGADAGLGPLLVTSMRNVRVPQLWATGLVITAISAVSYGMGGLLESVARARLR